MLTMVPCLSSMPSCNPEIEHNVLFKKKKRKISKFGFVPSHSPDVITDWNDEGKAFPDFNESIRHDRKREREVARKVSPPRASTDEIEPAVVEEKQPGVDGTTAVDIDVDGDKSSSCSSSSDESDTDEEEIMLWAHKMFGCPLRPPPSKLHKQQPKRDTGKSSRIPVHIHVPPPVQTTIPQFQSNADEEARARRKKAKKEKRMKALELQASYDDVNETSMIESHDHPIARKKKKQPIVLPPIQESEKRNVERDQLNMEEERERRQLAKPLTKKQIREILKEDDFMEPCRDSWVRRSMRRPCNALLHSKPVRSLVRMLKSNHSEMVVLKMKKYINDPDAPQVVLDKALEALEENTNCEALFIQNFNEGMRDRQVLHLLRILQRPSCNIWCLNIGEIYNVDTETWEVFTKGLRFTKITHMYASEHTITTEMKDVIRATIRENRSKHDMHINPNNLDVIVQCTHCWWNPINAKRLRPYLKKSGYEQILHDKEAQGMKGSISAAPTI